MIRRLRFVGLLSSVLVALTLPWAGSAVADDSLAGKVIVLDPGHQLGNGNPKFFDEVNATRWNGTLQKGCNTTGAAMNKGYPEATFTWEVVQVLAKSLRDRGATVHLTRTANDRNLWGPCTWDRAAFANDHKADVLVSVHADGAPSKGRGFFVIAPGRLPGWTDDIAKPSRRLARAMIGGMTDSGAVPSTYVDDQLLVWTNQSTLNFSDVPAVIVEVGNMRNKADAKLMSHASGQRAYAKWLEAGIVRYFLRAGG
ncbi:MAG: N-acetylmuramoyl-L-alanine amidase [Actinomycetales bacterium]